MAERLWAPWRISYVEAPTTGTKTGRNIFLELPGEDRDEENLILFRGRHAFVILNKFPYSSGHLLIAPYRETDQMDVLDDDELLEINQLLAKGVRWIRAAYAPDGYNIGVNLGRAAGAGIPQHIHWHIVPRWSGDTNFMTTVGEVRVLPESLEASYQRLRKAMDDDLRGA